MPDASELRKVPKPLGAIYKSGELISAAGDILSRATALRSQNHCQLLRVQLCEPGVLPRRCIYRESPSADPHPSAQERSWSSAQPQVAPPGLHAARAASDPTSPNPISQPGNKAGTQRRSRRLVASRNEAPSKCNKPAATGKQMGRDGGSQWQRAGSPGAALSRC